MNQNCFIQIIFFSYMVQKFFLAESLFIRGYFVIFGLVIISDNFLKEELNLTENVILENPIKLAIYTYSLKGGGTERVTSLFVNFISKIDFFNIYLFSQKPKEDNEFKIPQNINRIFVKYEYLGNLIKALIKKKIDVLIYQFPKGNEISILNQLKTIKIIFYENSCFLYWIYYNYYSFKLLYNAYKRSKYVISLVPFEND